MKIQTGMKCKQTKVIEEYGLDYVGMEFEIVEVNNVIKCKGNNVYLNIDINEFENYFELIKELSKEKELKKEDINHKGKRVKIINTDGFNNEKDNLENYIGQTGIVRYDWQGNTHRLSIKFDDNILDNINDSNGRLCFRIDSVEFIVDEVNKEKINNHAKLGDIVELSNGLKMEICIDEKYPRYYRTVDISTKENVTTIISEHSLKTYCIGNRVWGYGSDKFAIVNIKHGEVKSEEIKETKNDKRKSEVKEKPSNQVYTYEMIPHNINWVIKHNNEIIHQVIDSGSESYKLITNGNTTIVILDDGCKGVAKCLPSDEYDLDRGVDIAYTKAMIKSYQKKLKELVR